MKKILLGMAAISALAAAAPAVAQGGYDRYEVDSRASVSVHIAQLRARLDAGVRSGAISRTEADPLNRQIYELQQLHAQFSRNGISGRENSELRHRITAVRQALRSAESRRGGWGGDRDDRYEDRDDRWGGTMDRNRDGYDDRDLNRDGRISDSEWRTAGDDRRDDRWEDRDDRSDGRWEDRDDRWEERSDDRRSGGIGGVIQDVLGVGGLRVGQRVSANARLGAVPSEYRSRFRDGDGVYYRSDGRSVYQIDARTDVVLRIYDIRR
jgi:hypothetical protein